MGKLDKTKIDKNPCCLLQMGPGLAEISGKNHICPVCSREVEMAMSFFGSPCWVHVDTDWPLATKEESVKLKRKLNKKIKAKKAV